MCGIAGWVDFSTDLSHQEEIINKMTDTLISRGPDDSGYWFSKHVAFGQRKIIDSESKENGQTMVCQRNGGNYVLVHDGELYNGKELKKELLSLGLVFQNNTDTEVLLNAYIQWGEECVNKFNGVFAFAIWDENKEQLFLARDRIGIKPLFYSIKNNSFLFSSEIKGLLAHPMIRPSVTREGLSEIFVMGPARTPGQGVFKDISEIKPGFYMTIDKNGYCTKEYWSFISKPHHESLENTIEAVRELVHDAINRQLLSEVPIGTMLSGGLDSSAITALAAELYKSEGKEPLRSFSVDYIGNDVNFHRNEFQPDPDAPWAKLMAEYLSTRHHTYYIDTPQLTDSLFRAVIARDLPGMTDVDSSLFLFSCEIRKYTKVAISGEGADEVFGGYPWFYRKELQEGNTFPWTRRANERFEFYSPELLNLINPEEYMKNRYAEALLGVPRLESDTPENALAREMSYLNLTRWMPTLLDRNDRMSMAAGLKIRVPFCDHRLVEYLWNIPWEYKFFGNREKGLLRKALTGVLPENVLWRKKSPYPKTHNPEYLNSVRGLLMNILDDTSSPLLRFIVKDKLKDFALSITPETNIPWFGQLMNAPQMLAYFVQVDYWLREYHVELV